MVYVLIYYDKYDGVPDIEFFQKIPDPVKWTLEYLNRVRIVYEWDDDSKDWYNRQGDALSDAITDGTANTDNFPMENTKEARKARLQFYEETGNGCWTMEIPDDGQGRGLSARVQKCPSWIHWEHKGYNPWHDYEGWLQQTKEMISDD